MKSLLTAYTTTLLLFTITSCKKFVDVDSPTNQLVTETVFKNDATAISALTEIYAKLSMDQSMPATLPVYLGMYGDELKTSSTNASYISYYTNNLIAAEANLTNNWWTSFYKLIYESNAVFEGCNASTNLTPSVKKQLMAEARFLRAFCYFYLTNLWGNIPLIITTDYNDNSTKFRIGADTVYEQIEADLKYSIANLSPNYLAGNTVSISSERVRANSYAAMALLSRVCLYQKKYTEASTWADKIINNESVYKLESLSTAFLKNSKEAIWQLALPTPYNNTGNTLEGYNFILTNKPSTTTTLGSLTISEQLLDSFEPSDGRLSSWIGTYTDVTVTPNVNYRFANKFKQRTSTSNSENSIPIRISEIYLIRAEARLFMNNLSGAADDLNAIRLRAGLQKSMAKTNTQLFEAIIKERQSELFTEWGHRWLDMKRTGKVVEIMTVLAPKKGGTWSAYKALLPIAQKETQNNPNLLQTPGYNN